MNFKVISLWINFIFLFSAILYGQSDSYHTSPFAVAQSGKDVFSGIFRVSAKKLSLSDSNSSYVIFSNRPEKELKFSNFKISGINLKNKSFSLKIGKYFVDYAVIFETDIKKIFNKDNVFYTQNVYSKFTAINNIYFTVIIYDNDRILDDLPVKKILPSPITFNTIDIGNSLTAIISPLTLKLTIVDFIEKVDFNGNRYFKYIDFKIEISRIDPFSSRTSYEFPDESSQNAR